MDKMTYKRLECLINIYLCISRHTMVRECEIYNNKQKNDDNNIKISYHFLLNELGK